jgi:hypothetical protein
VNGLSCKNKRFRKNHPDLTAIVFWKGFILTAALALIFTGIFDFQPAWSSDPTGREELIASLVQGEIFENDGSTYACLPTLRAQKTRGQSAEPGMNGNDGSISSDSVPGEAMERKGLFTVYRQQLAEGPSIRTEGRQSAGTVLTHPVVLNLKTKSIGIVTGKLWLKLRDIQDARIISDAYGMTLSFVNVPMSTSFYEIPAEVDILELRKRLQDDSRILGVTLDMVDRIRHPE